MRQVILGARHASRGNPWHANGTGSGMRCAATRRPEKLLMTS